MKEVKVIQFCPPNNSIMVDQGQTGQSISKKPGPLEKALVKLRFKDVNVQLGNYGNPVQSSQTCCWYFCILKPWKGLGQCVAVSRHTAPGTAPGLSLGFAPELEMCQLQYGNRFHWAETHTLRGTNISCGKGTSSKGPSKRGYVSFQEGKEM